MANTVTVANVLKEYSKDIGYSQVNNLFLELAKSGNYPQALFVAMLDSQLSYPKRYFRGVPLEENEGVFTLDELSQMSGIPKGSVYKFLDNLISLGLYKKRTVGKMVIIRKVWIDDFKKVQQEDKEPDTDKVNIFAKEASSESDNHVTDDALVTTGDNENSSKYLPSPLHARMKLVLEQSFGRKLSSVENSRIKQFYWKIHGIVKASNKAIGDVKITEDKVVNGAKFFMILLPTYIREGTGYFTLSYILNNFETIQTTVQENKQRYLKIEKWWSKNTNKYDSLLAIMSTRGILTKEHAFEEICKICSFKEFANPFQNDTEQSLEERQHRFVVAEISKREKIII